MINSQAPMTNQFYNAQMPKCFNSDIKYSVINWLLVLGASIKQWGF